MEENMKNTRIGVIIVAGGSGTRMGAAVPKQFMELCGEPVLVRTLRTFIENIPSAEIVVVLPESGQERWKDICRKYGLEDTHTCCTGGETRFGSVKNALEHLPGCDVVLVHDGVRPLVPAGVIKEVIGTAVKNGTAVPVVKPVDSFRLLDGCGGSEHFDREKLGAVQTPQGFAYGLLKKAYGLPFDEKFTDDASVVEKAGGKIVLCDGSPENIKITSPADLLVAETFLKKRKDVDGAGDL